MSHTNGPWEYEISEGGDRFFVYGKDRVYVVSNEFCDAEEVDENARLIAAAPEMIPIVKKYRDFIRTRLEDAESLDEADMWQREVNAVDAVLDKAAPNMGPCE